jgi:hypothetical protein
MISRKEFLLQSLSTQIGLLYEHGVCVMNIRYYGYKVNLYLLEDFYLEVFYNHKKDQIEKIIPLNPRHSRMDFYTAQIKLPVTLQV